MFISYFYSKISQKDYKHMSFFTTIFKLLGFSIPVYSTLSIYFLCLATFYCNYFAFSFDFCACLLNIAQINI